MSIQLVDAKCTKCGGELTVDKNKDIWVCEFCGSQIIVREAIEYYNIINNINAQNVNITAKGEAEKERLLANAEYNLTEFKKFSKAKQIYMDVTEDYPSDYRGWFGIASAETSIFTDFDFNQNKVDEISNYINNALICARNNNPDKVQEIQQTWSTYTAKHKEFLNQKKNKLKELEAEKMSLEEKISTAKKTLKNCNDKFKDRSEKITYYNGDDDEAGIGGGFFNFLIEASGGMGLLLILGKIVLFILEKMNIYRLEDYDGSLIFLWASSLTVCIVVFALSVFGLKKKLKKLRNSADSYQSRAEQEEIKIDKLTKEKIQTENEINKLKSEYKI